MNKNHTDLKAQSATYHLLTLVQTILGCILFMCWGRVCLFLTPDEYFTILNLCFMEKVALKISSEIWLVIHVHIRPSETHFVRVCCLTSLGQNRRYLVCYQREQDKELSLPTLICHLYWPSWRNTLQADASTQEIHYKIFFTKNGVVSQNQAALEAIRDSVQWSSHLCMLHLISFYVGSGT